MADAPIFRVHRSQLLPAIDAVIEGVDTRASIPILGNILLSPKGGELMLRGTDLAIEIETSCDLLDEAAGSAITVSGPDLKDIIRNLPENAEISFLPGNFPDQVRIQAGRSRFSLLTLPEKDFPSIADKVTGDTFSLEISPLIDAFSKVTYAIRDDKTRVYLSGTYIHPSKDDRISVVGCDGHNLAAVTIGSSGRAAFQGIIIPIKTGKAIKKLFGDSKGSAEITISSATMRVALGGVTLISKVVDGIYPDYPRLFPEKNNHSVTASVATFKAAVSRVCLVGKDVEKDTVRLRVDAGVMTLTMDTAAGESAVEDIPVDYDGDPIDIGFNGKYLTAMLSSITTQDVEMHLTDPTSPGLFTPTIDRDERYVLMPRRR